MPTLTGKGINGVTPFFVHRCCGRTAALTDSLTIIYSFHLARLCARISCACACTLWIPLIGTLSYLGEKSGVAIIRKAWLKQTGTVLFPITPSGALRSRVDREVLDKTSMLGGIPPEPLFCRCIGSFVGSSWRRSICRPPSVCPNR